MSPVCDKRVSSLELQRRKTKLKLISKIFEDRVFSFGMGFSRLTFSAVGAVIRADP